MIRASISRQRASVASVLREHDLSTIIADGLAVLGAAGMFFGLWLVVPV